MNEEPSVVLAGPIFHNFMEKALQIVPEKNFIEPNINY
jgi:membrane carboxypeptidase/penicillin-binding protein